MIYKLVKSMISGEISGVTKTDNGQSIGIPFDPANTDYQNFKAQINADKAQLEDADGDVMSAEEAKAYVATLP
jgi:hypothetical protein